MRISDWSSDVCSSDLHHDDNALGSGRARRARVFLRRRQLCLCAVRRRHRSLLGTKPGSGISERSARPLASRSQCLTWPGCNRGRLRSEEHTSELQSLMRISYAVFCLKKKKQKKKNEEAIRMKQR